MRRSVFTIVYLMIAVLVLFVGLNQIQSVESFKAVGSMTLTCEGVFGSKCPDPGQCSYNSSKSTGNCTISCWTKITFNGVLTDILTQAECNWETGDDSGSGDDDNNTAGNAASTWFWQLPSWW